MTAQQFLHLGEDPAGVRLELVDGEVAVSPSPTPKHSFVVMSLALILGNHLSKSRSAGYGGNDPHHRGGRPGGGPIPPPRGPRW